MATRPCEHCGAFLDAPRHNQQTGHIERKCSQCLRWTSLTPHEELREVLRIRAADRRRRAA
jgi:phage FluMu protein Com